MKQYLEDLTVGEVIHSGSREMTEAAIIEYAKQWDPQPMHVDPVAAAAGMFGGLIASGWHTAAVAMLLTAEAKVLGDTPMLGMGVEKLQWPKPVRPGDVLRVELTITAIKPSKSKPEFGIVSITSTAFNQDNEVVFVATPSCWVPRRPA